MVNKNKLLSKMIDCGFDSQRKFAQVIGMNKDTFNLKINNKSDFKTGEIEKICKVLNIVSDTDKVNIFLQQPSQK